MRRGRDMKIERMTVGMLQEQTYFAIDETSKRAFIIDPGADEEAIIHKIDQDGLKIEKILLTHGHFDHMGAAAAIKAHTGCEIIIHEAGERYLQDPTYNLSSTFGYGSMRLTADHYVKAGDTVVSEGTDLSFKVIHAPGHTLDGVAYYNTEHQIAFVGDIIFKGSIGRTDFIGGDAATLLRSISEGIFTLAKEVTLYPGHGEPTTVGFEILNNPYFNMFE